MPAPLGANDLLELGGTLLFGGAGLLSLLVFVGIGVYLAMCAGSRRQWDGSEHRWRHPGE